MLQTCIGRTQTCINQKQSYMSALQTCIEKPAKPYQFYKTSIDFLPAAIDLLQTGTCRMPTNTKKHLGNK